MGAAAAGEQPVALSIGHLRKTYPDTVALDDVSLELRSGETHALICTTDNVDLLILKN